MLVAVRAPGIQLFTETSYTPLTTARSSGRLLGNAIWSLSSTYGFQQLRYTNSAGLTATADFGNMTSLSALNARYNSYTCTPNPASVTSNANVTNFYFRGQSGRCTDWSDSCDWAALAFSTTSICDLGDFWDSYSVWWILSGESCTSFQDSNTMGAFSSDKPCCHRARRSCRDSY